MVAPEIALHVGDRGELLPLFRLADDSETAILEYLARGTILVARVGGAIVGHVQMIEDGEPATWELKSVAVLEAHRRGGLGRSLVEAGVDLARHGGARRVVVSTATADTRLLRFYQLLGFRMTRIDRDVFTPEAGYPPDLTSDGIRVLDRVWLELELDLAPALVERALAAGRAAWPELDVPRARLAAHLAERLAGGAEPGDAPLADLYLACACALGDPRALAAFERAYLPDVDAAAAAMRAPPGAADEVKQILRTRFFVAEAARPAAIGDYAGRGDLHGWVRVAAVRELLRLGKRSQREVPLDDALVDDLALADPETAALKARCGRELGAAFRDAIAALPPRSRTLLRYQLVDGLGVTEIGAIHRVHRATAARWLARIREDLVADVRRRLADQLRLSAAEARSLIRLVQSRLELSLVRLLAP